MKSLATLTALAFALSAFAQNSSQTGTPAAGQTPAQTTANSATIKIKSKGDDIRTVIDSIFEQAGKQYVLETNFHQSIYMNLDGVAFDKAVDIIAKVADLEFNEKQGIWYIRTMGPALKPAAKPVIAPLVKTASKTTSKKTASKSRSKTPAEKLKPIPAAKDLSATEEFAEVIKQPIAPKIPAVDLTGKLTVQLKKMDIREVFSEFGRQSKVDIEIDETVPNYKLDAYFYNTSLKFALDKVCKVAGLKYSFTPSKTVRISKA